MNTEQLDTTTIVTPDTIAVPVSWLRGLIFTADKLTSCAEYDRFVYIPSLREHIEEIREKIK